MRKSLFLTVALIFLISSTLFTDFLAAETSMYTGGGEGPLLPGSHAPCVGGETVLLIQDNVEWFAPANQDPRGANVTELEDQEKDWCAIHSNQIGTTNLAQFKEIVIAAAQIQTFYNNLFPSGVIHPALTTWVLQEGGILIANLTDCASGPGAGGTWATQVCNANTATSFSFIGGVKHTHSFQQNNNIADPNHPIITTADLPCSSGNCAPIVDVSSHNDLDNWNSASHGYFTNLPTGTIIILTQPDVTGDGVPEPVMIEYPFGNGTVIATQTTTEWRYAGNFGSLPQNRKLLANMISLVFTLNIPLFKQSTSPWGSQEYDDGTLQPLDCGTTIQECGCATSSVAMVLAFHGVTSSPDGNPTNPGTVNDYFKLDRRCTLMGCVSRGYSYGSVVWTAAEQYSEGARTSFSTPIIEWNDDGPHDANLVSDDIENGRPVILKEPTPGGGTHFVVATGIFATGTIATGKTFMINDPGFRRKRLDHPAYGNTSLGLRRYIVTGTDLSRLVVSVLAPVQVLVTDPNGNRTGFDPVASIPIENIPHSSYFFEDALADDLGVNPPPPAGAGTHMAIIRTPMDGRYTIEVISPPNTDYSFAAYAYDSNATLTLNVFEAQIAPGEQHVYNFTYNPSPGAQTIALVTAVDIKPGSFPNSINPKSKGVIPVAILTTSTFDATTVDPLSVRFGPNGATEAHGRGHIQDADGDGDSDLVLHFNTQATGIKCGDTSASITGQTFDGQSIEGSDSIRTVGCK